MILIVLRTLIRIELGLWYFVYKRLLNWYIWGAVIVYTKKKMVCKKVKHRLPFKTSLYILQTDKKLI